MKTAMIWMLLGVASPLALGAQLATQPIQNTVLKTFLKGFLKREAYRAVPQSKGDNDATYAAVVRCFDPQGTGHPKDKLYCSTDSVRDDGKNEERIKDAKFISALVKFLSQDAYYGGIGQGWVETGAVIRCSKDSCTAEVISNS